MHRADPRIRELIVVLAVAHSVRWLESFDYLDVPTASMRWGVLDAMFLVRTNGKPMARIRMAVAGMTTVQ